MIKQKTEVPLQICKNKSNREDRQETEDHVINQRFKRGYAEDKG
jgi:hypothetical protein